MPVTVIMFAMALGAWYKLRSVDLEWAVVPKSVVQVHESVYLQVRASTTRSPVSGFTPPSASVAPITARSTVVTSSEHCFV